MNKIETKEPSFEDWGNNWHFVSFGSPYGTGTNTIECANAIDGQCVDMVDVTASYGNYWEVSLDQPVSVVADQTYILTFYARNYSYTPSPARVAIALNHSPWTEISSVVPLEITFNYGALIKYQIELTPNVTESDARLIFYLGESVSTFFFDQVKLWPKQATKVSDSTPEFSAIYDDPDSGDTATDYQIQVIKYDGDWNEPVWDSGKTSFTTAVSEGDRSEDISYGGNALPLDGMKYKWRIKLWDESDNEGDWTNGEDFFTLAGKRIQDLSYTYDNVGNVTQIVDQSETNTRKNAVYAYDDLYRLTSATITDTATDEDYTQTYTYDSLGNTTYRSDLGDYDYEGNTGASYANPHAVTGVPGAAVNYDNNGNMLSEVLTQYNWTIFLATWDYNNRMTTSQGWFTPVSYAYDHTGQRIIQNLDSGDDVTIYPNKYYNTNTKDEVTKVTEHIFAHDAPIATMETQSETTNLYFIHGDHLNSSSVMTDSDAQNEQVIDYFPFGNTRFNEQSVEENPYQEQLQFTSHFQDQNTDLTYMGARYYIGVAGKFLSEDPVFQELGGNKLNERLLKNQYKLKYPFVVADYFDNGTNRGKLFLYDYLSQPQQLNSYSYVMNDPLTYRDPQGELGESVGAQLTNFISGRGWKSDSQLINIAEIPMTITSPQAASINNGKKEYISSPGHTGDGTFWERGGPIRPSQETRNNVADRVDVATTWLDSISQIDGIPQFGHGIAATAGVLSVYSAASGLPELSAPLAGIAVTAEVGTQIIVGAANFGSLITSIFSDVLRKGGF